VTRVWTSWWKIVAIEMEIEIWLPFFNGVNLFIIIITYKWWKWWVDFQYLVHQFAFHFSSIELIELNLIQSNLVEYDLNEIWILFTWIWIHLNLYQFKFHALSFNISILMELNFHKINSFVKKPFHPFNIFIWMELNFPKINSFKKIISSIPYFHLNGA
jgi:hypothetical protein